METKPDLSLDTLLNDIRLDRLFEQQDRPCALQLFVLSLCHKNKDTEQRLLYGRLVPYNYADHCWHVSHADNLSLGDDVNARLDTLTLYAECQRCKALVEGLWQGETLGAVSQRLNIAGGGAFLKEGQGFSFRNEQWVLRPVIHLTSRGAHANEPYESPYDSEGACSAALVLKNKITLFEVNGKESHDLFYWCVKQLSQVAGLTFTNLKDCSRLGELEFMVFPMRGDDGQCLLSLLFDRETFTFELQYDVSSFESAESFVANLKVWDDGQLLQAVTRLGRPVGGVLSIEFHISEKNACYSELQLEIYIKHNEESFELCGCWGERYFRGINISTGIIGAPVEPVKTKFFRKDNNLKQQKKNNLLMPINQGEVSTQNLKAWHSDEWVDTNSRFLDWVRESQREPSSARFFPSQAGRGADGGIQFVQWLKESFQKYPDRKWILVDPYFDEVGLQLLSLAGSCPINFEVITAEQKGASNRNEDWKQRLQSEGEKFCHNTRARLVLCILNDKAIHDRYLWIEDTGAGVVEGFHLSNSLQGATQLYPLLITPIPKDVLWQVQQYVRDKKAKSLKETLIFDAKDTVAPPTNPIDQLMGFPRIGEILSELYGIESFKGLCGDELKQQLVQKRLLGSERFYRLPFVNALSRLAQTEGPESFAAYWRVFATVVSLSMESLKEMQRLRNASRSLAKPLMKYLQVRLRDVSPDQAYSRRLIQERLLRTDDAVVLDPCWYKHSCAPLLPEDRYAVKTVWSADAEGLLSAVSATVSSCAGKAGEENDTTVNWDLVLYVVKIAEERCLYCGTSGSAQILLRQPYAPFRQLGTVALWHKLLNDGEVKAIVSALTEGAEKDGKRVVFTWLLILLQQDKTTVYRRLMMHVQDYSQTWVTTASLQEIMSIAEHKEMNLYASYILTDLLFVTREQSLFDLVGRLLWKDFLQRLKKAADYRQQKTSDRESFLTDPTTSSFYWHAAASYFSEVLSTNRQDILFQWRQQVIKLKRVLQRPLASASQTGLEWDNAVEWCRGMYTLELLCRCHLRVTRQSETQLEELTDELADLSSYADREPRFNSKKDLFLKQYQARAVQLLSEIETEEVPQNFVEMHPSNRINWMRDRFGSIKTT